VAPHRSLIGTAMRGTTGMRAGGGVLGLMLVGALSIADADSPHTLLGTWRFDPVASRFDGGAPYRSGISRFIARSSCIHVSVEIVEARGTPLRFEYCDPSDDTYVTVRGNPFYDSQSTQWPDSRTAIRTEKRGAQVIGMTTMSVAADGNTYTATSDRIRPDGVHYTSVILWRRVDD
jgi:hypothetical protein